MLYSKMFGKTNKSAKEFESVNATLLTKGGFIDQTMAGVYTFLPLGLRVLTKIENIVREEMSTIGDEILMSSLVPQESWQITGRFDSVDVLFKATGANEKSRNKNDTEYVLSPTHEECVTPLAKKFNFRYKELPFAVFQIQTKYRNEARAKSGLLRGREFRMKDLYSFHKNEEEFKEFYERSKEVYFRTFQRLGLGADTILAAASGGDFTDEYSHEFQTKCETGEDTIFYDKDAKIAYNKEVAPSKAPQPVQEKELKELKDVFGEGIKGVDDLCKFLNINAANTSKTLVYTAEDNKIVVTSLRGDYEVNEEKLRKAAKVKGLALADAETVKRVTGAEVGYAGLINLPADIILIIDDSLKGLVNFETGANKTNYHTVNVNWGRDIKEPETFYDIKVAKEGDMNPETGNVYEVFRASEVGNIFPLFTKFTKPFNYYYLDKDGKQNIVIMGCYGLGTTRVMGVLVEKFHDDKGIIWPESVAPFTIHLIGLNLEDETIKAKATEAYETLEKAGIDVLFDDRTDISAGEKFADADLIGCPFRIVLSKKTGDKIELKKRNEQNAELMELNDFLSSIHNS